MGPLVLCHTIFNGIDYMQQQNYWVLYVENSSMSKAERGTYDGHSCFEVYKYFNSKVVCRNQKAFSYPYWWDSSRFNIDLVPFCRNENFRQFMTPPPQFNQRYQTTWPNQCIFTSSISRWRQVFIQKWWNN